jgi:hypothetical protein
MSIVEACTRETSGNENDTEKTDTNLAYTGAGFLVTDKQIMLWNPKDKEEEEDREKPGGVF